MFFPATIGGKIFKCYLKMFSHPSKVRIQNLIGKYFFPKGILLKNEEGLYFFPDANDWITRTMLMEGNYESGSTGLAKTILKNGGLFIDVGANFGLFTAIAAFKNKGLQVLAVEPNYKILPRLLHHMKLNGLETNVQVINAAVSKKLQLVTMEQPAADNLGTTVTKAGGAGLLKVLSCPLDFICSLHGKEPVTLLKIDIEGNEFDILEDFPFEQYIIKNVILEFNYLSAVSFDTLRLFFQQRGFDCFTITGEPLLNQTQGIIENNIWFVNRLHA
ncbi:MAG: FkbM family methyltransferase [Chitinophagaceae bacterium]|nr:FkbM family methyltransferase [Chitinophagaceae bacterium]